MSEQVEIGGADFASLRGRALVEVLETLEPSRLAPGSVDLNQLLAAIDPADLRQSDFRKLLTVLVKFAAQDSDSELGAVDARTLIRLIAGVPREQLDAALAVPDLRTLVLEEIFRRMEAHVRSERVKKTRAVVRWRLTGGTGTGGFRPVRNRARRRYLPGGPRDEFATQGDHNPFASGFHSIDHSSSNATRIVRHRQNSGEG